MRRSCLASTNRAVSALLACLLLGDGAAIAHDPHDPFVAVAVSPNFAQDHTLLAATGVLSIKTNVQVLMKSTDGGVNWSILPGFANNGVITALAFSPGYAQDQTIFVTANQGLFESTNQGTSWSRLYKPSLLNLALSPNFAVDNTLFVLTTTNAIVESTNRGQTWTVVPAPFPLSGGLSVIAVSPNFDVDQTVFLGTVANGIYASTNACASWISVTPGLFAPTVSALAFSPGFSFDQTVIAALEGQGVMVSTNAGNSWTSANAGLSDLNVTALALSPTFTADSTFWAATGSSGVFQTTTLGASWNPPSTVSRQLSDLTPTHYQALAAASSGSGAVLFMAMYEGLWTSIDNGSSWQYIDTWPTRIVRHINMSPGFAQDGTVFASTYGGGNLWSTNAGLSWTFQNTGMQAPYTDASGISPNFTADGTAFSSNYLGLQRSTDWGATWQMMQGTGTADYPRALAVSPNFANDQTVFIGTEAAAATFGPVDHGYAGHHGKTTNVAGLYISTDGGNTWTLSGLNNVGVDSIAMSPGFATDLTAFAASTNTGLYRTTNGGLTWNILFLPGAPGTTAVVAVSPSFPTDHTVMAGAINGGIYRSTDGGNTWTELAQSASVRAMDIRFSPNFTVDQTVFAGTAQEGVMMSTNGGHALTSVASFPDTFVMDLAISPNYAVDGTIFAASYHGMFESTNRGATWSYVDAPSRIEETRNITSILQEPPTIGYDGLWSFLTASLTASTYGYTTTMESQDTASVSFIGSGIRWLSLTGQDQGTASIQLDGVPEGAVSLYAANADQFQQSVWEQHGIACGPHTFTITALPQVLQSVALDAFDIWVDTCPATIYANSAALSGTSATVGSAAGSGAVTLTATGNWTAYSNAPWLHLSIGSTGGFGSAAIQYTYDANPNAGAQIGTLTIAGLTYYVTQAGTSYAPATSVNALAISGLSDPQGVAVDSQGNVYIADTGNNAIKQWNAAAPQAATVVVSGLSNPAAVAVDQHGNVFFANSGNNSIQEWSAANPQAVTVVSGLNNPSGVAVDAQGNIYIANTGGNTIQEWNVTSQQMKVLVAGLNSPRGVALDAQGNVYFSDSGNNAVKEWTAGAQQVATLVSGLNRPSGVAVDGQGNVYFADSGSGTIREWSPLTQQVTVLVASGLSSPAGVALDGQGNIYVADSGNNAVREVTLAYVALSANSLTVGSQAGTDSVTAQVLPAGIPLTATSDQSWLTVAGIAGGVIGFSFQANNAAASRTAHIAILGVQVTVTQSGDVPASLAKCAGDGQGTPAGQPFATPLQACVADSGGSPLPGWPVTFSVAPGATGASGTFSATPPMPIPTNSAGSATAPALTANGIEGTFTVTATVNGIAAVFSLTNIGYALAANSVLVGSAGGNGTALLVSNGPWTAAANSPWLQIAPGSASGVGNASIQFSYNANSNAGAQTGTLAIAGLTFTVTQAGTSYVAVTPISTLVSSGLNNPQGVAVDGQGNVYIADTADSAIKKWTPGTPQPALLVSGLNNPAAVAVDGYGNVYIADTGNHAIKEFGAASRQLTTLVPGLSNPSGVAVDGQGNVYFSDTSDNNIDEWNASSGQVTTLAGSGLSNPTGVAVDAAGNVYFADSGNNAVKKWAAAGGQVTATIPAGLNDPTGVAVDGLGSVYTADTGDIAIKEWNAGSQQVATLASAGLNSPMGTAVDAQGNIYVADTENNAIEKLTPAWLALSATSLNETYQAGTDSVTALVLPASVPLTATSDQSWLTVTGIAGGIIGVSFPSNIAAASRTAHIAVLGLQVTVTQNADTPANLTKCAGDGQGTPLGQPFATALQVCVTDAGGNPLSGALVAFSVTPGATGAGGTFSATPPMPIPTNAGGIATAPALTANAIGGTFTVT
ncbi:MAG TPA: BACON domain-containing carbohydrate-binding protein, partial [Bryobacteraceae bacterium]|nr:BACON domain-containing carbohydrate-binding protein [Bryobacteraceae bacterium]